MENDFVVPTSSIKLDCTAKGLVVPTVHVYVGATDEQLDQIRKMAVNQLKRVIIELEESKLTTVVNAS